MTQQWDEEKVSDIYVESGYLWLGDPVHILNGDDSEKAPKLDALLSVLDSGGRVKEPLNAGMGTSIVPGRGDGVYPVYVKYNEDGLISEVRIVLIDEE